MRIAICDNDKSDLDLIIDGLENWTLSKNGTYSYEEYLSATKLQEKIRHGESFDIYVLDIVMPKINGIELGKLIRENNQDSVIIYTTSSDEYALNAFGLHALRYLSKPIQLSELNEALDAAETMHYAKPKYILQLTSSEGVNNVNLDDVMYIENSVRTIMCTMNNGQIFKGTHYDSNFEKAVGIVEELDYYIRVHKSFYVNMKYVKKLSGETFVMDDDKEVFIASRRLAEVRMLYMKYVSQKGGIL